MFQNKIVECLTLPAIYRSIGQVLETLTHPEVIALPEVKKILSIGVNWNVLTETNGFLKPESSNKILRRSDDSPFVVIEGLDGSGKTTLTKYLEQALKMKLLATPPQSMKDLAIRNVMDNQSESVRRAYYSLGNYVAAKEVIESESPVIMDRFWHSTAAYAFANIAKSYPGDGNFLLESFSDVTWPSDLLTPNLVIFLTVSEEERLRRHSTRGDFTNTVEEQTLATDIEFRRNLASYYRSIRGVPFKEVNVDCSLQESETAILNCVLQHFPSLKAEQS